MRAKPSSPAGGNRGRPPRDLIAVADQWLEKLKKAEESDSGLFGDGRKESTGFVKRLKDDLKLAENKAKEGVAFEAFSNRRRRIEAALNLLQCANQKGAAHEDFREAFQEASESLQRPPMIQDDDWPSHWHSGNRVLMIQKVSDTTEFWSLVGKESVLRLGDRSDPEVCRFQSYLVETKIISITKANTLEDVTKQMAMFFDSTSFLRAALNEEASACCSTLSIVAWNEKNSAALVKSSADKILAKGHSIYAAVLTFDAGRQWVSGATQAVDKRAEEAKFMGEVMDMIRKAKTSVLAFDFTIDSAKTTQDLVTEVSVLIKSS